MSLGFVIYTFLSGYQCVLTERNLQSTSLFSVCDCSHLPSLLALTLRQVIVQSVQEVKVLGFCQLLYSTG